MIKDVEPCCMVCGGKLNIEKVKIILKKDNGSEIEMAEEYVHIDCFYKLLDKAECRNGS